jgi:hypothetical protein
MYFLQSRAVGEALTAAAADFKTALGVTLTGLRNQLEDEKAAEVEAQVSFSIFSIALQ